MYKSGHFTDEDIAWLVVVNPKGLNKAGEKALERAEIHFLGCDQCWDKLKAAIKRELDKRKVNDNIG